MTTTNDIDAIRPLVERYPTATNEYQMDLALRIAEAAPALLAKLDGPCGSCHPCTNYRDETWRAANRKPPHVIEWDDAQDELKALRAVVEAAKAWRKNLIYASGPQNAALMSAVDALPNPADHLDICPGYGCPGCREVGA